ncbi:hypothetical protein KKF11_02110 [Patescibacteria group bacterium]|nr:hypothetical protein [Patescibacteria group bacterium]
MSKQKTINYFLPFFIWFLVVSLIRFKLNFDLFFLLLGGVIGTALSDLDHLIFTFFVKPQEITSLRVKKYLQEKKIKELIRLLIDTRHERKFLVFHSVVFQTVLIVLVFFVLTSSDSFLGTGMVMGLMLRSLTLQAKSLLSGEDISNWFWQFGKKPNLKAQKLLFAVMIFIFFGFSYFFTRF